MRRLANVPESSEYPLARYARAGVCPYVYVTELSATVARARVWWDNGSLGMSLMDTPLWLIEAMELYGAEMHRAMKWNAKD